MVLPWKPPQQLTNSYLPVYDFASRRALSTASAPPEYICSRCTPLAGAWRAERPDSPPRAPPGSEPTPARRARFLVAPTPPRGGGPSAPPPVPPLKTRDTWPSPAGSRG